MSKSFSISMPFAGVIYATVEAESKEEALEKFYERDDHELEASMKNGDIDHYEWSYYEKICSGNVCHVSPSEMTLEEEE